MYTRINILKILGGRRDCEKKYNTDLKEDLSTFAIHPFWNALLRLQTQISKKKSILLTRKC